MIEGPKRFGGLIQDMYQKCNSLTKQWILRIQVKIFVSTHLFLEDIMDKQDIRKILTLNNDSNLPILCNQENFLIQNN